MSKIKTFKQACKALGIPDTLPDVSALPKDQQKAITAHYQLIIIAQALNGGWKPDWNDSNQWKYYPYFDMRNGFSFGNVGHHYRLSVVGSRLCFETEEMAEYAGTQFLKLYKDYFTYSKK